MAVGNDDRMHMNEKLHNVYLLCQSMLSFILYSSA